jgi:hypothetical protein
MKVPVVSGATECAAALAVATDSICHADIRQVVLFNTTTVGDADPHCSGTAYACPDGQKVFVGMGHDLTVLWL